MYSIPTGRNLSGNFRITSREHGAINYLRFNRRMNMQHIRDILGRSLATVHRVSKLYVHERMDNRGQTHNEYMTRQRVFSHQKKNIQIRLKLWFNGFVDTLQEALEMPMVPLAIIESENTDGEEDEEPA